MRRTLASRFGISLRDRGRLRRRAPRIGALASAAGPGRLGDILREIIVSLGESLLKGDGREKRKAAATIRTFAEKGADISPIMPQIGEVLFKWHDHYTRLDLYEALMAAIGRGGDIGPAIPGILEILEKWNRWVQAWSGCDASSSRDIEAGCRKRSY